MPRVRKLSGQELHKIETASKPDAQVESAERTPSTPIDTTYPHLAGWVFERGWIEIGSDENSRSFIRVLDGGGMVWEGKSHYPSLDRALYAANAALAQLEAEGEL
jgi:hypothetical protein